MALNKDTQPLSTEEQHKLLRELERDASKWDGYLFFFVTAFVAVEGFGCLFHALQGLQDGMSFHTIGFIVAFFISVLSSKGTIGLTLYRWEANEVEGPSQPSSVLTLSKAKLKQLTTNQTRLALLSLMFCSTSHTIAFFVEDLAVCDSISCHVLSLITWHKIAVAFWQSAQHALLSFAIPAMAKEMEGPLRELQGACYNFEKL
jgi:hypothetical protein